MPINDLATTQRFTSELDKMFAQKSVTGFMLDNAFKAKFVGTKTVLIPSMELVGLANYDRDAGYTTGGIKIENESHEITQDRSRSFLIDVMDADETGIAELVGKTLSELVRTKVVPECDAYVLSKLYGIANTKGKTTVYNSANPYGQFLTLEAQIRNVAGFDEELVAFVDTAFLGAIQASPEISRLITVSDFKQGEISFKVKNINGVSLIPVDSGRMRTQYVFEDTDEGGFTPTDDAGIINCLILPKKACSLVKKHETVSIFTPEQVQDHDAYRVNYRIHYDAFVKKSGLDAIGALYTAGAAPEQSKNA